MWTRHSPGGPAPRTSALQLGRKLYGTIDSFETAGLLILRELPRRSTQGGSAATTDPCACCCAVSDEVSQGAYLDKATRFSTGMAARIVVGHRISYYIPALSRPLGDRRHFSGGHECLPSLNGWRDIRRRGGSCCRSEAGGRPPALPENKGDRLASANRPPVQL